MDFKLAACQPELDGLRIDQCIFPAHDLIRNAAFAENQIAMGDKFLLIAMGSSAVERQTMKPA